MNSTAARRILVVVDESGASDKAVAYVGKVLGGLQGFSVDLMHMVGPLPPSLKESPGAETPADEERVEQRLVERQNQLIGKSTRHAAVLLKDAQTMLGAAGIPAESIKRECPVAVNGEDVVTEILNAARDHGCGTVVVGRQSFGGLKEIFSSHLADKLIREGEGLAFWVVE